MNITPKYDDDDEIPSELCNEMLIENKLNDDEVPPEFCNEMLIESSKHKNKLN